MRKTTLGNLTDPDDPYSALGHNDFALAIYLENTPRLVAMLNEAIKRIARHNRRQSGYFDHLYARRRLADVYTCTLREYRREMREPDFNVDEPMGWDGTVPAGFLLPIWHAKTLKLELEAGVHDDLVRECVGGDKYLPIRYRGDLGLESPNRKTFA